MYIKDMTRRDFFRVAGFGTLGALTPKLTELYVQAVHQDPNDSPNERMPRAHARFMGQELPQQSLSIDQISQIETDYTNAQKAEAVVCGGLGVYIAAKTLDCDL